MKRILSPLALVFLIVALAGCGTFEISEQRMQFALTPDGNLGYEIDDTGAITVTSRGMTFRNAPGASALQLTGVEVAYFDASGNEVVLTNPQTVPGSLNIYIPAGIICDDPHEELGCTMNSANPRIAPSPLVETPQTYQLLEAEVAFEHAMNGGAGWYAEIVFTGFTSGGFSGAQQEFVTQPYRVGIVAPN